MHLANSSWEKMFQQFGHRRPRPRGSTMANQKSTQGTHFHVPSGDLSPKLRLSILESQALRNLETIKAAASQCLTCHSQQPILLHLQVLRHLTKAIYPGSRSEAIAPVLTAGTIQYSEWSPGTHWSAHESGVALIMA